jgi:hypothetical protein
MISILQSWLRHFYMVFAALLFLWSGVANAADKGGVLIYQKSIESLLIRPQTLNGKNNSKLFGKPVKVPTGEHVIGLRIEFYVTPDNVLIENTDRYADIFEFKVTLEPGRQYQANGTQAGRYVEVWLEDKASKEVISDVVQITVFKCKPFKRCQKPKVTRSKSGIY